MALSPNFVNKTAQLYSLQAACGGREFHLPRGKMIGGSSGINFMAYGRPCRQDLDDWGLQLDLPGWSWDDLLPYFKKSERLDVKRRNPDSCQSIDAPFDADQHGNTSLGGIIHSSIGPWQFPIERALHKALTLQSGVPNPSEPYSGEHIGFYRSLFTIDRSDAPKRSYAAHYLLPSLQDNISILTEAFATKIRIETVNSKQTATGVYFSHRGKQYSVSAKQVVVSAGSFQSPQLLQLSGIGDPIALEKVGVTCIVKNTHVGKNLQEHVMCPIVYELAPGIESADSILANADQFIKHQALYNDSHDGAFSGAVSLTGYLPYSSLVSKDEFNKTCDSLGSSTYDARYGEIIMDRMRDGAGASPDIQFVASPGNFDAANGYSNCAKIMTGAPPGGQPCYSVVVSGMYPASHGSVQVNGAEPFEPPTINPNFLSHPADIDILVAGLRFVDQVFGSKHISNLVHKRISPPLDIKLDNATSARDYVRNNIVTYHHAIGTCSMGMVVDHRLCVKGVDGLRIVDASVMPTQVSAATMATVYALAEKAAAMIQEDLQS